MKCTKCNDTGWYSYDHNHRQVCDGCCTHSRGFWLLKEHYGENNGKLCCSNGCGFIKEQEKHEMQVQWTECCGHTFPVRIPEDLEFAMGQDENFWKQVSGKRGKLIFVSEEG